MFSIFIVRSAERLKRKVCFIRKFFAGSLDIADYLTIQHIDPIIGSTFDRRIQIGEFHSNLSSTNTLRILVLWLEGVKTE